MTKLNDHNLNQVLNFNCPQRFGLRTDGPLIKSLSGELSNLRWDLPAGEIPVYYKKENREVGHDGDWALLQQLMTGLAGGGPVKRSAYLFDHLNLPEVRRLDID